MSAIELLAPARDLECGRTAIDCGADAVYIGAPRFGAREAAGNSLEDIAALVQHAHAYWAKVYVTLNTILRDEEIAQAEELVARLYEIGIDGLIIQDVGLLECDLPPVPLIASTQMHNHTPERVAFLEQVGIQRAILARELTLEEIREIRRNTRVELECFVHGAICVGYSGQCYLSYALGGRSGNRGQCAQPCRKPYTLRDATGAALLRDKHLLSLRDLNLSDHLAALIDAGVTSFKIEGRLKDRSYVANVVAHYRARLDALLAERGLRRASSGTSRVDFTPDPAKTFNRGYTTHFLHGRGERQGAIDTPKMMGEPVGTVTNIARGGVTVEATAPLHAGDGICFFDRRGELRGTTVNAVRGATVALARPEGLERGTPLYRNHDHEFLTRLAKSHPRRQIAVSLALRETADGLALAATDEDGNMAEHTIACEKQLATKPEQALANTRKQLGKAGDTEFACEEVTVALDRPLFLPISTLNALRRETLAALAAERTERRPKRTGGALRNSVPYPEKQLAFTGNVLNRRAESFYRRHGVTDIEAAAEAGLDLRDRVVMTSRYCVKHQLGLCPREKKEARVAEPLSLVDAEGRRLQLRFDCARCQMEITLPRE